MKQHELISISVLFSSVRCNNSLQRCRSKALSLFPLPPSALSNLRVQPGAGKVGNLFLSYGEYRAGLGTARQH